PLASEPHNPWFLLTRGAARHRAGQHRKAIRLLCQALRERWNGEEAQFCGTTLTSLFLSLAHHHLGEVEEARRWLNDAARSLAKAASQGWATHLADEGHNWAACQILYREAESLITGAGRPR